MRTASPPVERNAGADRFLAGLADVQHDASSRNTRLARLGAGLLALGVALAVLGLVLSQATDNPLDQSTDLSLGLAGIAVGLGGLGLFLRYSFAQFLRFWLLRLIYEQSRRPGDQDDAA